MEVSISYKIIRKNQLKNKLNSGRLLYKATQVSDLELAIKFIA